MQTIQSMLEASARTYPHRVALHLGSSQLTYTELWEHASNAAVQLQRQGISKHTTVALLFQNTLPCVVSFLALAFLNTPLIPLGPETSTHELDSIYTDTPFSVLLGDRSPAARFDEAIARLQCRFVDVRELLAAEPIARTELPQQPEPASKVFLYHYTSGSMGTPKAALHSQTNLINGGLIYQQTFQIKPDDRILVSVPLAHSFGLVGGLIAALVSGARLIMSERFVPRHLLELVAQETVTILIAVPFVYDLLVRSKFPYPDQLASLRLCLSSGSALLPEIAKGFTEQFHKHIFQIYGSTETGVIAAQWQREEAWPAGAVGAPLTGIYIRIVDEQGQDLPPNTEGTLLVKTPAMFMSYHRHPEATAQAFKDGWYVTGDIAQLDRAGHLYLTGRKDTFVNVGGKKVNPVEVEQVLLAHPAVRDVLVSGRPAGGAGEHVHAAVVLSMDVSESELLAFCREKLAFYKVPSRIEIVTALPKTSLGKTRRRAI